MSDDRAEELARIRAMASTAEPEDLMERARAKARALRDEKTEAERQKDIETRFMMKGPRQYRVLNDDWWNR
jgi:hypothetical protein